MKMRAKCYSHLMNGSKTLKSPHKIVIVGGGAGGLELATQLGKAYGRVSKA